MATIAAVLIVRNEAAALPRCLAALDWVDEIVVVDDDSTDDTVAIAEAAGARVFRRRLDRFDVQRNYAIEQTTCEWILSIDADEVVTPALAREIRAAIGAPDAPDVYGIPFRHRMFGHWFKAGGWTAPLNRLFRRERRWGGAVHERVAAEPGAYRVLRAPLLHYSHRTIAEFVAKLDRYTDHEAAERVVAGAPASTVKLLLSPTRDFVTRYLLQMGFLDGIAGLVMAELMWAYVFMARAKAIALSGNEERAAALSAALVAVNDATTWAAERLAARWSWACLPLLLLGPKLAAWATLVRWRRPDGIAAEPAATRVGLAAIEAICLWAKVWEQVRRPDEDVPPGWLD